MKEKLEIKNIRIAERVAEIKEDAVVLRHKVDWLKINTSWKDDMSDASGALTCLIAFLSNVEMRVRS